MSIPISSHTAQAARCSYWRRTLHVTLSLLSAWALVSFVPVWFAADLERWRVFGWPLPYFLVAQVALVVFAAIVWLYAYFMDKLDRRCLQQERES